MDIVICNAGEIFNLELSVKVSISRSLSFDLEELKLGIDGFVRSFLSDERFVNYRKELKNEEESKDV